MPIDEVELHPYLGIGESISATRMIVGTFPIYSLTNPRTPRKEQLQQQRSDISFFYGSRSSAFWSWYRNHVDATINVEAVESIVSSLEINSIAISDVIKKCSRVNESFEDKDLRISNGAWNSTLGDIIYGSIDKILCTSKGARGAMGWLRDKILEPYGFNIDHVQSTGLHHNILNNIPNSNPQVLPVAQVLNKGERRISIVALPSPGSPVRRLGNFGFVKASHTTDAYLQAYLSESFNWFLT
jgi:hypothetical protein